MHESKRRVPYSQGQALADEFGIQFFETSAKSNIKVDEVKHRVMPCCFPSCCVHQQILHMCVPSIIVARRILQVVVDRALIPRICVCANSISC